MSFRLLIVEIDGGIHESQKNLDHQRQQLLESLGLRFVRVSSEQVETNLVEVLALIRSTWNHPHPLTPSPIKGEGELDRSSIITFSAFEFKIQIADLYENIDFANP
jgi:hypothetical protein